MKSWFEIFVFVLLINSWIKSEKVAFDVDDDQACGLTECQQLQNRIETLEAAVRTIVSALATQKGRQFAEINNVLERDPALLAVLPAPTPFTFLNKTQLNVGDEDCNGQINLEASPSRSTEREIDAVNKLKGAIKCSLIELLDINTTMEEASVNPFGKIQAMPSASNSLEIIWTPLSNECLKFISGFWVRVFESDFSSLLMPRSYLDIPHVCLSQWPNNTTYSVILHSPTSSNNRENETCHFKLTNDLIQCLSYKVEVVPNYQSLKGNPLITEIVIPSSTKDLNTMSLTDFSMNSKSLVLSWKDNSGCSSQLTSFSLKIIPDGKLNEIADVVNSSYVLQISRSCLNKQRSFVGLTDSNEFSLSLPSINIYDYECNVIQIQWKRLDLCRRYTLIATSDYSNTWTSAPFQWETLTSNKTLLTGMNFQPYWNSVTVCNTNEVHCQDARRDRHGNILFVGRCIPMHSVCDGRNDCSSGIDEMNCDNKCIDKFQCGPQCIKYEELCNTKIDCLDGSDELGSNCSGMTDYAPSCNQVTTESGRISWSTKNQITLLSVQTNYTIWLAFNKCKIHNGGFLKVYDGPFSTSPLLLDYSGSCQPLWSVRSSRNDLYIEFFSFSSLPYEIDISYMSMPSTGTTFVPGCGGYVYDNGFIPLPWFLITGGYSDVTDCVWFVEAGQEENIIFMRKGTLETKSNPISSITVYDGWSPMSKIIFDGQDLPNQLSRNVVYSVSQKMMIHFRQNQIVEKVNIGYPVTYYWIIHSIPTTTQFVENLRGAPGTIKSPNYPVGTYPNLVDYRWIIQTVSESKIRILFAFFETQEGFDYVYVYDGPTITSQLLIEKSGSIRQPFTVTSSTNQLLIRFTSDDNIEFSGFLAVYSTF